jgi:uncharacterized protein (TIRG00374 family)
MPSKLKHTIKIAVKITVTSALFAWVLFNVDTASLEKILFTTKISYIVSAALIHGLSFIILSVRWWLLYNTHEPQCNYRDIASSYYLGLFFNNFLPTSMGGDLVRFFHLYSAGFNSHLLISSTFLDRVIGLFSIILMGLLSIFFIPKLNLSDETYQLVIILTLLIPIGVLFLLSKYTVQIINKLPTRLAANKISEYIVKLLLTFSEYKKKWRQLAKALLLSFLAQSLIILCYIMISLGLNIQLPISTYFAIVPLIFLATSIPLSVGGLGIRESVIVYLFTYFGTGTQPAIALSLIYFTIISALTLPGALVMLRTNYNRSFGKRLTSEIVDHNNKSQLNT